MKKYLLINASPRNKGTSVTLANMCMEYLLSKGHSASMISLYPSLNGDAEKLYKAVFDADVLIISGPCYINTYPADTTLFLENLAVRKNLLHGQELYGIIQGGMPYVHTHECGLLMLKAFGLKSDVNYKGGFVMGGGAMLDGQPVTKLPNGKKVARQLNIFFDLVSKGEEVPIQLSEAAELKIPRAFIKFMAKLLNRMVDDGLKKHGIDVNQPSPYLRSIDN